MIWIGSTYAFSHRDHFNHQFTSYMITFPLCFKDPTPQWPISITYPQFTNIVLFPPFVGVVDLPNKYSIKTNFAVLRFILQLCCENGTNNVRMGVQKLVMIPNDNDKSKKLKIQSNVSY